ncbi:MAG: serine/threonine-protein kinase [Pirellulales bacterium]
MAFAASSSVRTAQQVQVAASDEPSSAERVSPRVGPWRLVSLAGEGAWTRVYRASPMRFPESAPADYAVKMLRPEYQHDALAARLLQREELVGRQVTHPHLAPVLSSRIDRKPFFVTTPFLEGAVLRDCFGPPPRTPLPVSASLWVARQIAEALTALHTAGWLHGDVKPGNIFVAPTGHSTLIDLGFARRLGPHLDAHAVPWDQLQVLGTPAYAAPEIHHADPSTDPASDVYSLGVVLFEMLTGRWPFEHADPRRLAAAHCQDPPPDPREFAAHLPARVSRLVLRLLAKPPDVRPTSFELVDRLIDLEISTLP